MGRLDGKVVVVTGATKGIGRGIALALSREGANVVAGGRNIIEGTQLVDEIKEKYNMDALFVKGDISIVDDCQKLITDAVAHFGKIDGLVNNAGIFPYKPFLEIEEKEFDQVFATNIKGAFFCSKYAVAAMLKTGCGSIVNMGSTHAFGGGSELSVYACSKGALHTFSKYIAKNYAKNNIRSNWITIGWVLTPGEVEGAKTRGYTAKSLENRAKSLIPVGKLQTEEDMAMGVVYLLSDEAGQVTGTDLHITGGFNLP